MVSLSLAEQCRVSPNIAEEFSSDSDLFQDFTNTATCKELGVITTYPPVSNNTGKLFASKIHAIFSRSLKTSHLTVCYNSSAVS